MAVKISQSHANLIPPGATLTGASVFRSLPFYRPPGAAVVTFIMLGTVAGTLDIEALYYAGNEGVAADWYTYNTSAEQVAVSANSVARITILGGAPVMRILYTPNSSATVSKAEGIYTSGGSI